MTPRVSAGIVCRTVAMLHYRPIMFQNHSPVAMRYLRSFSACRPATVSFFKCCSYAADADKFRSSMSVSWTLLCVSSVTADASGIRRRVPLGVNFQNRGSMFKQLSLIATLAGVVLAVGYADQSKSKVTIPVDRTSPTDGKQMFNSYCAPCHGVDGRGAGPAASALKTPPVDLTALARMNHGKYPDAHVLAVLQFGSEIPAHGSAEMPIWGPILSRMSNANPQDKDLRMGNLSRYLEKLQVK
jgi:mono/diheme cytochrome c family protein